jgi:hypothetical protein
MKAQAPGPSEADKEREILLKQFRAYLHLAITAKQTGQEKQLEAMPGHNTLAGLPDNKLAAELAWPVVAVLAQISEASIICEANMRRQDEKSVAYSVFENLMCALSKGAYHTFPGFFFKKEGKKMDSLGSFFGKEGQEIFSLGPFFKKEPKEMHLFDHLSEIMSNIVKQPSRNGTIWIGLSGLLAPHSNSH